MDKFKGYFLGFTFKNIHSSTLKIVRINTGDRAEMSLSPEFNDIITNIPGRDGYLYFNTNLQKNDFAINFAFDSITETEIKGLRDFFNPKEFGTLILDENPYKGYTVKVSSAPKLSYIVFDEGSGKERIYKGEGSVLFTSFNIMARAPYKTLEEYDAELSSGSEWSVTSGIKAAAQYTDILDTFSVDTKKAILYNPGDVISPLNINFTKSDASADVMVCSIYIGASRVQTLCLNSKDIELGSVISINSETKIITCVKDNISTIKNSLILAGDFLFVEQFKNISSPNVQEFRIDSIQGISNITISYPYLYY